MIFLCKWVICLKFKSRSCSIAWQFFVTFLGWLSDPFHWLSDLQIGDTRVTSWWFPFGEYGIHGGALEIQRLRSRSFHLCRIQAILKRFVGFSRGEKTAPCDINKAIGLDSKTNRYVRILHLYPYGYTFIHI